MNTSLYKYFILSCFLFCSNNYINAQNSKNINLNLSEVALLDIEPSTSLIQFTLIKPSEAGKPIEIPVIKGIKWLNYTSAIRNGGNKRNISAQVENLIPGLILKIKADSPSGTGKGTLGIPTGTITLNNQPITIITGIGGAYTGNGINNGHLLNYSLEITDYKKLLQATNHIMTITYTISN